jgi:hypothetical protein
MLRMPPGTQEGNQNTSNPGIGLILYDSSQVSA